MVLIRFKVPTETQEETQRRKIATSRHNYVILMCYFAKYVTNVIREAFHHIWRFAHQRNWQNTPQEGDNFAKTIGRRAWLTASRRQKLLIESGASELWDLKLLTHVILRTNFGPENNLSEDLAHTLCRLTDLQHFHAAELHDVIADDDTWEEINQQLKFLVAKFDSFILIREPCTAVDKMAEEMMTNGNFLVHCGKVTNAIDSYTSALKLTLCKPQLAKIYANRSTAYLHASNEYLPEESRLKMALEDAKRTISLNPDWFRGYHRLGNVYTACKKYRKARKCFDTALRLEENRVTVIEDMRYCERELAKSPQDGAVVEKFKTNLAELTKVLWKKFGPYLSWDELCEEIWRSSNDRDPEVSVFRAQCLCEGEGNWMLKDVDEAVRMLWEVAAEASDFAGALYLLGLMAASGSGIERNPKMAFSLFLKAASFPLKLSDDRRNVGVNEAEYELGICYEKSIGISGDLETAAYWFAKAAENGNNDAAIRLGMFYVQGRGVERNLLTAEYYFTMAAERNSEKAMRKMAAHCAARNDRSEKRTENKHSLDKIEVVEKGKRDPAVRADDKRFPIRNLVETHPDFVQLRRRFPRFPTRRRYSMFSFDYSDSDTINIDVPLLKSIKKSITARDLLRAVDHFHAAADLLCNLNDDNAGAAIHQLAQCLRMSGAILDWNPTFHKAAQALVWRMLELADDAKSQLDSDLRVCSVLILVNDVERAMEYYEISAKKYRQDAFFPILLCNALASVYRHERAIQVADEALEYLPGDVELMYWKAEQFWRYDDAELDETISAFRDFLRAAPIDHRMAPESCFKMAACLDEHGATGGEIRNYFRLGCAAENRRLAIFPPVDGKLKATLAEKMFVLSTKSSDVGITVPRSEQLGSFERVELIKAHREAILGNVSHVSRRIKREDLNAPLDGFESLTLREVEIDAEYEGFVLYCTVIDDPVITEWDFQVLVEDENGDVARMRVCVVVGDEEVAERFGFGCRLGIVNPYVEAVDVGKEICVDDLGGLVGRGGREVDKCRFCGKCLVRFRCGVCKKGYCGEECQVSDWKILKHKYVCGKLKI